MTVNISPTGKPEIVRAPRSQQSQSSGLIVGAVTDARTQESIGCVVLSIKGIKSTQANSRDTDDERVELSLVGRWWGRAERSCFMYPVSHLTEALYRWNIEEALGQSGGGTSRGVGPMTRVSRGH